MKIAFATQKLQEKLDDQLFYGTVNPTSAFYCSNFFGFEGDIAGYTAPLTAATTTTTALAKTQAYVASLLGTTGNYIAKEYYGHDEAMFPTTYEEFAKIPEGPEYIFVNFDEEGNITE